MSTRNEPEDVIAILATDLSSTEVLPFLETASAWVDAHLSTLSADLQAQVEKWLAAHLVIAKDPRLTRVKAGPVDVSFLSDKSDGAPDEYLKVAIALDSTGIVGKTFTISDVPPAQMFVGKGFRQEWGYYGGGYGGR